MTTISELSEVTYDKLDSLRFKTIKQIVDNNGVGMQKYPAELNADIIKYSHLRALFYLKGVDIDCGDESYLFEVYRDIFHELTETAVDGNLPINNIEHLKNNKIFRYMMSLYEWGFWWYMSYGINNNLFEDLDVIMIACTKNEILIKVVLDHKATNEVCNIALYDDYIIQLLNEFPNLLALYNIKKQEIINNGCRYI